MTAATTTAVAVTKMATQPASRAPHLRSQTVITLISVKIGTNPTQEAQKAPTFQDRPV